MSIEGTAQTEYASLSGKIHTLVIDKTLSISGAAADAKATGDRLDKLEPVVEEAKELYEAAIEGINDTAAQIAEEKAREAVSKLGAGDVGAYSKAEVLTDGTKAVFGLEPNATPDNVFAYLGKYNQHWWSCLHGEAGFGYEEKRTTPTKELLVAMSGTFIVSVSDTINIDQTTGAVSLASPVSVTIKTNTSRAGVEAQAAQLAGKYITGVTACAWYSSTDIFYAPGSPVIWGEDGAWAVTFYLNHYIIGSQIYNIPAGATTYVHSVDRNAYPDSGMIDGISYEYLGVPFDNAVTAPAIATGSYTGTGTYGSANPNSLTFDFEPKFIIFFGEHDLYSPNIFTMAASGKFARGMHGLNYNNNFSYSNGVLTWYTSNSNDYSQLNSSGKIYYYTAIG